MSLPTLATPTYTLTLPSNGKKVEYRPFLVKEEKLLMLANETKDPEQIVKTMRQIVLNCTFEKINVNDHPTYDIEYIFINLRARSVGEKVDVRVRASSGEYVPVSIDLNEIEVQRTETHTNKVKISDKMGIIMKAPTFDSVTSLSGLQNREPNTEDFVKMACTCIESIYDETQTYDAKDYTPQELIDFVENTPQKVLQDMVEFFNTLPYIGKRVSFVCPKTGETESIMLRGTQDFFTS